MRITGQLFITCAVAKIATVLTSGKNTATRKIKDIHLTNVNRLLASWMFLKNILTTYAVLGNIKANTNDDSIAVNDGVADLDGRNISITFQL